eukprot:COSAG04_NODE_697_length_11055_cov_5.640471_13_plen_91_part_00
MPAMRIAAWALLSAIAADAMCEPAQYAVLDARNETVCHECATCGSGQMCIRQGEGAGCADCPAGRYNINHDPVTGCVGALVSRDCARSTY